MSLIMINNLKKSYKISKTERIHAVNDVSFSIQKGEILGLVGESGCGKSTLGKLLLNLETSDSGEVLYHGKNITRYSFSQMRKIRKELQMVFQNNSDSFNPYYTVRQIIMEPLKNYNRGNTKKNDQLVEEMIQQVGLDTTYLNRYGNELSGGQRQRVGIARALILTPEFAVCDEAVSALDYAVRNKILKLLIQLKQEKQLTYLFISHDLSAINQICNRVIVMYRGEIMEILPSLKQEILHPYTKALLAAALGFNPRNRTQNRILFREEELPIEPEGCAFYHRCLYACDKCKKKPPLVHHNDKQHFVACHLI